MKFFLTNPKNTSSFFFLGGVCSFLYSYIYHVNSIFYFSLFNVAVCFSVLLCFSGQLKLVLSNPKAFIFYRRLRLLKRSNSLLRLFRYTMIAADFLAMIFLQFFFVTIVTMDYFIGYTKHV